MYFYYYEIHKWNEVVNGGVTIILFVVTNIVCVPKKRNLSTFRGGSQRRAETHKNSWMEMEKRCNSGSFGNGKILGARRRGWSVSSWLGSDFSIFLIEEYRYGFFSYLYRIEHAEPNLLHVKPAWFRSGESYGFMKPCAMARIRIQSYFR
jgi:hypothetical protein